MTRLITIAAMIFLLAAPTPSSAQIPYLVVKASLSLDVQFQGLDAQSNPVVKVQKLSTNDIINLALGRSLSTKPDKNTEVLALAADDSTPGLGSLLVVFNPNTQAFTTNVWTQSNVTLLANQDFSGAVVAIATLTIPQTTLGSPSLNGFLQSTLSAGGSGKGENGAKGAAKSLSGTINFKFTDANNVTTTINGIVIAGKFKAGGKSLGVVFQ